MSIINNYFEEIQYTDNIENLFYAIMYRRWDKVVEILDSNCWKWNEIKDKQYKDYQGITIKYCFECNLDFLKSVKNRGIYEKLCNKLGDSFKNLVGNTELFTYDDKRFYKNQKKSALEVFWDGNQPVLNLTYFEKQTIPAQQVMKNNCSMVLDEVGTGKTVAGIYTIQQVIQDRINNPKEGAGQVAILVVCPYNKREDWYSDILRQLGRESNIVEQSDNGNIILQKSTRSGIPQIYISGNVGGQNDGTNQQLKKSLLQYKSFPWDLVIIDECHNCFKNYKGIKANRILLLTATPIVVSGDKVRAFNEYEELLNTIMGGNNWTKKVSKKIDPLDKQIYSSDDIFVCNFKEDIFDNIKIDRQIEFVECERCQERQDWFYELRYKKDFFSAIFADQDDNRLADKMSQIKGENCVVTYNDKLDKLIKIILGQNPYEKYKNDSFLIFCETKETVELIFDKISGYSSDKLMIGKLHSDIAEIKNVHVNKDTIIPVLKNNIRIGNRSILITTGKSGGTGLNLGEFNTVVHYELPFSSNELEQRFGRIERADDLISYNGNRTFIKNKMVFLINKAVNGESDFVTNRMLYYAINKIQVTVNYMPIRNTVLFHPEYINRVKNKAIEIWSGVIEKINEDETIQRLTDYFTYAIRCDEIKQIVDSIDIEFKTKKDLIQSVNSVMNNNSQDEIEEGNKEKLKKFYNDYVNTDGYENLEKIGKTIIIFIEYYLWLKMTLAFWGIKINDFQEYLESVSDKMKAIDEERVPAMVVEEKDDSEKKNKEATQRLEENWEKIFEEIKGIDDSQTRNREIQKKSEELLEALRQIQTDNIYSGVFYVKDGKIVNKKFE